jgi:hypothetical protein
MRSLLRSLMTDVFGEAHTNILRETSSEIGTERNTAAFSFPSHPPPPLAAAD